MAKIYQEMDGHFVEAVNLWDALKLEAVGHSVISLVGAGGKTSTMFRLAEECKARGKKVIVTTSTHMSYPDDYPVLFVDCVDEIQKLGTLEERPDIIVVSGSKDKGKQKISGLPDSEIGKLRRYCDVLLIEADGSRRLPFKVPAGYEPVVIEETEVVIGCVGLSSIGKKWQETCFRWELAEQRYAITGEDLISPEHIARILMSEDGTRKYVDNRTYRIVLNQMDGDSQRQDAEKIMKLLHASPVQNGETVVAASCYI